MAWAMAEPSGSETMTKPEKSSLRPVDEQLGQVEPWDRVWHLGQALSLISLPFAL